MSTMLSMRHLSVHDDGHQHGTNHRTLLVSLLFCLISLFHLSYVSGQDAISFAPAVPGIASAGQILAIQLAIPNPAVDSFTLTASIVDQSSTSVPTLLDNSVFSFNAGDLQPTPSGFNLTIPAAPNSLKLSWGITGTGAPNYMNPSSQTVVVIAIPITESVFGAGRSGGASSTSDGNRDGTVQPFPIESQVSMSSPRVMVSSKDGTSIYWGEDSNGGRSLRVWNRATGTTRTLGGYYTKGTVVDGCLSDSFNPANNVVSFASIDGLALDAGNNFLYLSDMVAHVIRQVDLRINTIRVIAGTLNYADGYYGGAFGDDPAGAGGAYFNRPVQIVISRAGDRLYVADSGNQCVRQIEIPADATSAAPFKVTTIVGVAGSYASSNDNDYTYLNTPMGVALDAQEQYLYIADVEIYQIRRYQFSTQTVDLFLSSYYFSYAGPSYLTIDFLSTRMFITAGSEIKIASLPTDYDWGGNSYTIAGNGDYPNEFQHGAGQQARFDNPGGIMMDPLSADVLFVADSGNNQIRTIQLAGSSPAGATAGIQMTTATTRNVGSFTAGVASAALSLTTVPNSGAGFLTCTSLRATNSGYIRSVLFSTNSPSTSFTLTVLRPNSATSVLDSLSTSHSLDFATATYDTTNDVESYVGSTGSGSTAHVVSLSSSQLGYLYIQEGDYLAITGNINVQYITGTAFNQEHSLWTASSCSSACTFTKGTTNVALNLQYTIQDPDDVFAASGYSYQVGSAFVPHSEWCSIPAGSKSGFGRDARLHGPRSLLMDTTSKRVYFATEQYPFGFVDLATGYVNEDMYYSSYYIAKNDSGPRPLTFSGTAGQFYLATSTSIYSLTLNFVAPNYYSTSSNILVSASDATSNPGGGSWQWVWDDNAQDWTDQWVPDPFNPDAIVNITAMLYHPVENMIYIADGCVIRKVDSSGTVTRAAGGGGMNTCGDDLSAPLAYDNIFGTIVALAFKPCATGVNTSHIWFLTQDSDPSFGDGARLFDFDLNAGTLTVLAGNTYQRAHIDGFVNAEARFLYPIAMATSTTAYIAESVPGAGMGLVRVLKHGYLYTIVGSSTSGISYDPCTPSIGRDAFGEVSSLAFDSSSGILYSSMKNEHEIKAILVNQAPLITDVAPYTVDLYRSHVITIFGHNFGATSGQFSSVRYGPNGNDFSCLTPQWVNSTQVLCTIQGPFTLDTTIKFVVQVLVGGTAMASAPSSLGVNATFSPNIDEVSPSVGLGNKPVRLTLTGSNFGASASELVEVRAFSGSSLSTSQLCVSPVWLDSNHITCTYNSTLPSPVSFQVRLQRNDGALSNDNVQCHTDGDCTTTATFSQAASLSIKGIDPVVPLGAFLPTPITINVSVTAAVGDVAAITVGPTNGLEYACAAPYWASPTQLMCTTPPGLPIGPQQFVIRIGSLISSVSTSPTFTITNGPDGLLPPPDLMCTPTSTIGGSGAAADPSTVPPPDDTTTPPIVDPSTLICPPCTNGQCPYQGVDPTTQLPAYRYDMCQCYPPFSGPDCSQITTMEDACYTQQVVCQEGEGESVTVALTSTFEQNGNIAYYYITTLPSQGSLYQTDDGARPTSQITTSGVRVTNMNNKVIYQPPPNPDLSISAQGGPYTFFAFQASLTKDTYVPSSYATVTQPGYAIITLAHDNVAPVLVSPTRITMYQGVAYRPCCTVDANVGQFCECPYPFDSTNTLFSLSDVDAFSNPIVLTLSVSHFKFQFNYTYLAMPGILSSVGAASSNRLIVSKITGSTATVQFTGTQADARVIFNSFTLTPDSTYVSGEEDMSIAVNDQGNTGIGGELITEAVVTIDVLEVNQPIVWDFGNLTFSPNVPKNLIPKDQGATVGTLKGLMNQNMTIRLALADPDSYYEAISVSIKVGNGTINLPNLQPKSVSYLQSNPELLQFVSGYTGTNDYHGTAFKATLPMANLLLSNIVYRPVQQGKDVIELFVSDLGNTGVALPGQSRVKTDYKLIGLNIQYSSVPPTATNTTYYATPNAYNQLMFNKSMVTVDVPRFDVNISSLPDPSCAVVYQVNPQGKRIGSPLTDTPFQINDTSHRVMLKFTTGFFASTPSPLCDMKFVALKPQPLPLAPQPSNTAVMHFVVPRLTLPPIAFDDTQLVYQNTPIVITLQGENHNLLSGGQSLTSLRSGLKFSITSIPQHGSLYQVTNAGGDCFNRVQGAAIPFASTLQANGNVNRLYDIEITSPCGQVMFVPHGGDIGSPFVPYDYFYFRARVGSQFSSATVSPTGLGNRVSVLWGYTFTPTTPNIQVQSSAPGNPIEVMFATYVEEASLYDIDSIQVTTLPTVGTLYRLDPVTHMKSLPILASEVPVTITRSSAFPASEAVGTLYEGVPSIGLLYVPNDATVIGTSVDSFNYIISAPWGQASNTGQVSVTVEAPGLIDAPEVVAMSLLVNVQDNTLIQLNSTLPSSGAWSRTFYITTCSWGGLLQQDDITQIGPNCGDHTPSCQVLNSNGLLYYTWDTSRLPAYADWFEYYAEFTDGTSTLRSPIARVNVYAGASVLPPVTSDSSANCDSTGSCPIQISATDPKYIENFSDLSNCSIRITAMPSTGVLRDHLNRVMTLNTWVFPHASQILVFFTPQPTVTLGVASAESFTFELKDLMDAISNTATISISIAAAYDTPVTLGNSVTMPADTIQLIDLRGSSLTATSLFANITSLPTVGRLMTCWCPCQNWTGSPLVDISSVADRNITKVPFQVRPCAGDFTPFVYYVPPPLTNGKAVTNYLLAAFYYKITDGVRYSSDLSRLGLPVPIAVTPVIYLPSAFDIAFKNTANTVQTIRFATTNDPWYYNNDGGDGIAGYDAISGDNIGAQILSWPKYGTLQTAFGLTASPIGPTHGDKLPFDVNIETGVGPVIYYQPYLNVWGQDSFKFRMYNLADNKYVSNNATVTINVTFVLHRPQMPSSDMLYNLSSDGSMVLIRLPYSDPDRTKFVAGSPSLTFTATIVKYPRNGFLYQLPSDVYPDNITIPSSSDQDYGYNAYSQYPTYSNPSRRLLNSLNNNPNDTTFVFLPKTSPVWPLGDLIRFDRTVVTHPLKYVVYIPETSTMKDVIVNQVAAGGNNTYAFLSYSMSNGILKSVKPDKVVNFDFYPTLAPPTSFAFNGTTLQNTGFAVTFAWHQDPALVKEGAPVSLYLSVGPKGILCAPPYVLDAVTGLPLPCDAPVRTSVFTHFTQVAVDSSIELRYFPPLNLYGHDADSFQFYVEDSTGAKSNTVNCFISITHVNQLPVAHSASYNIYESTPFEIVLQADDPDDPIETLTFVLLELPTIGVLYHNHTYSDGTYGPLETFGYPNYMVSPARSVINPATNQSSYQPAQWGWRVAHTHTLWFDPANQGAQYPYVTFRFMVYDIEPNRTNPNRMGTIDIQTDCAAQFMFANVWNNRSGDLCLYCLNGAQCAASGNALPSSMPGYWRSDQDAAMTFIPCDPAYACVGGVTASSDTGCAPGFSGRRCGQCADRYYKLDKDCVKCSDVNHLLFAVFGYALPLMIVCGVAVFFVLRLQVSPTAISVLVTFAQTLSTFKNFNLGWPGTTKDAMTASSVFNLNIDLLSVECYVPRVSYVDKWLALMVAPFLVGLCLGVIWSITIPTFSVFEWLRAKRAHQQALESEDAVFKLFQLSIPESQRTLKFFITKRIYVAWRSFVGLYVQFLSMAFLSLSTIAMTLLKCTPLEDSSVALDIQPQLRCDESWWSAWSPVAIFFTVLYACGVPLLLIYILFSTRPPEHARKFCIFWCPKISRDWSHEDRLRFRKQEIVTGEPEMDLHARAVAWQHLYGSFISQFQFRWYFWSLAQMTRSLIIATSAVWLGNYPLYQACVCMVTMLISVYITIRARPYRESLGVNELEINCLACNTFVLFLGILFLGSQTNSRYPAVHTFLEAVLIMLIIITFLNILRLLWRQIEMNLERRKTLVAYRKKLEENAKAQAAKFSEALENELARSTLPDEDDISLAKSHGAAAAMAAIVAAKKNAQMMKKGQKHTNNSGAIYKVRGHKKADLTLEKSDEIIKAATKKTEHQFVSTHLTKDQTRIQHNLAHQHELWAMAEEGKLDDNDEYYSRLFKAPTDYRQLIAEGVEASEAFNNDDILSIRPKRRNVLWGMESPPAPTRDLAKSETEPPPQKRAGALGMSRVHMNLIARLGRAGSLANGFGMDEATEEARPPASSGSAVIAGAFMGHKSSEIKATTLMHSLLMKSRQKMAARKEGAAFDTIPGDSDDVEDLEDNVEKAATATLSTPQNKYAAPIRKINLGSILPGTVDNPDESAEHEFELQNTSATVTAEPAAIEMAPVIQQEITVDSASPPSGDVVVRIEPSRTSPRVTNSLHTNVRAAATLPPSNVASTAAADVISVSRPTTAHTRASRPASAAHTAAAATTNSSSSSEPAAAAATESVITELGEQALAQDMVKRLAPELTYRESPLEQPSTAIDIPPAYVLTEEEQQNLEAIRANEELMKSESASVEPIGEPAATPGAAEATTTTPTSSSVTAASVIKKRVDSNKKKVNPVFRRVK